MSGRPTRALHHGKRLVLSIVSAASLAVTTVLFASAPAHAVTDYTTTVTPQWYPNNGVVRAVLVTPDTIYLGGSFTAMRNANGGATMARNRLAAIDRNTHQLTSWNPGADNTVWALAQSGGVIYAGGDFSSAAGGSATRVAAINSAGAQVSGFTASANNQVRDFVVGPEGLYIGGKFSTVNGSPRTGAALVNPSTGAVSTWRTRLTGGRVFALADAPDGIVLGGNFDVVDGAARQGIAVVSRSTGVVTDWTPQQICDCPVFDLDVDDNDIYAAVGGGGGGRAVNWGLDDGRIDWVRSGDGDVQTIDYFDGRVYIGGHFGPRFLGQDRHQLAVVSAGPGQITSYALPFTGNDHPGLWAVHADASGLFIGGGFAMSGTSVRRFGEFAVS